MFVMPADKLKKNKAPQFDFFLESLMRVLFYELFTFFFIYLGFALYDVAFRKP